ncbi:MAG: hypothetical protein EOP48_27735 [Sphingobacteriales bacterium]|nr:MAG: hypothetical protein EOP48_27735 [Sphingobacteriales bacterium]
MLLELFWGIVAALPLFLLVPLFKRYFSAKLLAATILVAIAFIYVGFALKENLVGDIIIEVTAALVFYFIAIIGYSKHPKLIAVGILLHGLWDLTHHIISGLNANPDYWPIFCLTIDVIWSIYFYFIFKKEKGNV